MRHLLNKLFLALWVLPGLVFLTSCGNEEDPEPSMETYVQGVWEETEVTIKLTDGKGLLVHQVQSPGSGTYSLDGTHLIITSIGFTWRYFLLEQGKGQTFIYANYGANFSMEYEIIKVSPTEMVWQREVKQPGPDGEMDHTSLKRIYLKKK